MKTELFNLAWLLEDCLNDEVNLIGWHTLDAFLNHMISILIIDAINDRIFQFLN